MADKKELLKAGGATAAGAAAGGVAAAPIVAAGAVIGLAGYGIYRLFGGGKKESKK